MKKFYIIGLLILVPTLLVGGLVMFSQQNHKMSVASKVTATQNTIDPKKILSLINEVRVGKGLNKLLWNDKYCPVAEQRSKDIVSDFSHDKAPTEVTPVCPTCRVGENILVATGSASEEGMIESWIKSPTHLANIVRPVFNSSCIATLHSGNSYYVVQEFSSQIPN